jgi:hypothetical protein
VTPAQRRYHSSPEREERRRRGNPIPTAVVVRSQLERRALNVLVSTPVPVPVGAFFYLE